MKCVVKDQHILHVLKSANYNLFKSIIKNCDDKVIQTLSEIIHNVLNGNVDLDKKTLKKLKKYKTELKQTHLKIKKNKSNKYRRHIYLNQTGGFWPILLQSVLSSLGSFVLEKVKNGK